MVDTGRHPRMGFEPHRPCSKLESVNKFMERMAQGLEEAKSAIAKVKDEYTMYYNHQHKPAPVFKPGDKVWLDRSDIATNRPLSKLSHRYLGSFVIEACISRGAYCLALPPHFCRLHPMLPVVKLSITYPDPIPGRRPAPPPPTTLIDGEVEATLDS
jgi:hypothetical protein